MVRLAAIVTWDRPIGTCPIFTSPNDAGSCGASQTVASEAMTLSYTLFTAGTVTLGVFGVGDVISGTSVTTGSYITYVISGGGTTGSTMVVSPYGQTITTTVILAAALNVETKWTAMSSGLAGDLVKISSHPLG